MGSNVKAADLTKGTGATGLSGSQKASSADSILGLLGGAMILVAVYLLFFGGASDTTAAQGPPVVQIVYPTEGETITQPVEVRFTSSSRIEALPGGWGSGPYHLHLAISDREMMPAPDDIIQLPDGTYSWKLSWVGTGEVPVDLRWSDSAHRRIDGAGSDTVRVTVR